MIKIGDKLYGVPAVEPGTFGHDLQQQTGRRWEELVYELNGEVLFNRDPVYALPDQGTKSNPVLVRDVPAQPFGRCVAFQMRRFNASNQTNRCNVLPVDDGRRSPYHAVPAVPSRLLASTTHFSPHRCRRARTSAWWGSRTRPCTRCFGSSSARATWRTSPRSTNTLPCRRSPEATDWGVWGGRAAGALMHARVVGLAPGMSQLDASGRRLLWAPL